MQNSFTGRSQCCDWLKYVKYWILGVLKVEILHAFAFSVLVSHVWLHCNKRNLGMEFFLDQRKYIASSKIESFFCQTIVSAYVF